MTYFPQELTPSVSSALRRFTSVFGMGTGGTTSLKSPGGLRINLLECFDFLTERIQICKDYFCSSPLPLPSWERIKVSVNQDC